MKPPGVPKRIPMVSGKRRTPGMGIQSHRNKEHYDMTSILKSPYPWPGGKGDIAAEVWRRFGDVGNYVEPFAGTAVVCLQRPHDLDGKTETLNDLDSFICNALRAIAYAPEETADWCDWPVSEADLTATHLWLKAQRDDLTARLFADPDYCDPKAAGRWLWGIASWIGDGWCVADGPWITLDGRLVDRRTIGAEGTEGVCKKMPDVSPNGIGRGGDAAAYRAAPGVPRKMPEVGTGPNSQLGGRAKGVPRKIPLVASSGEGRIGHNMGVSRYATPTALLAYFDRLAARLRRVRLLCGDWRRCVKDSITVNHGLTGLFLDAPYPSAEHDMAYHGDNDIWYDVARWAVAHGNDPRLRIAVCGYFSEVTDAVFGADWTRYRWEARGGYSNQRADGRGRENAKRECVWFNKSCTDPTTNYGPLFAGLEASCE